MFDALKAQITKTPLTVVAMLGAVVILLNFFDSYRRARKLDGIPTVGPSGIFSSYIGAWRLFREGRKMVQEGYDKYHGGAFRVPMLNHWQVVVTSPEMINDIKRAPNDVLSFMGAIQQLMQIEHTMGKAIHTDPYHIDVIKNSLTRSISSKLESIVEEVAYAFQDELPASDDWIKIPAMEVIRRVVCRASNRVFVGAPLCRNLDYMDLNIKFAMDVAFSGLFVNVFPGFMRSTVARWISPTSRSINRAIKHVGPVIQERLDKEKEYGGEWPGKPNDFLSWLLAQAQGYQRSIRDLTLRILSVNFAAIHTTSMAFANGLYVLAAHPEYLQPLREEVELVVAEYGWTKTAMGKMRKLDSFLKESERLMGSGAIGMHRLTLKEFTFSDGTTVPAGTIIAVASNAVHHDQSKYSKPYEFDGFRYSLMREEDGEGIKHQMATPDHENWLLFGAGHHACPGRFFAVNELKLMLSLLILNYDVKFEKEGEIPPSTWFATNNMPSSKVEVMFRKRAKV
ncbi:hypothetical protein D9758_002904 [Tetrapyrgos nigripes]|uniref:Cytochrome P450 n=1 Tax=Tetrapyrgos nigripes TaxID=182062 RepID=A0A8H5LTT5_9AGAR|nr:hypothetical protein D9758_002904 [Tetrapyrgos nigripes]